MRPPRADRFVLTALLGLTVGCQGTAAWSGDATPPRSAEAHVSTATPEPTPTAIRTPPSLPGPYQSSHLNSLDTVHTYEANTCAYLRNKWHPAKATPGTVVMIIMLHSINRGRGEGPEALTALIFGRMMDDLHEQRFHAINMQQLAGFLKENARIPDRSVVLMQDQNRYPENFEAHFRYYWETWGWPVVNAWDHQGSVTDPLWEDYAALAEEGFVDFQAYGPTFSASAPPKSDEYYSDQLQKPIDVLEERLGTAPIGVVWPNGFSSQSARIARELGYELGFTFNPRGPVMYNWIPLSEATDRMRPSFLPEGAIGDPLMTLPRFWPHQVHNALDAVRITGKEAAAYAQQNRDTELEYYDIVCASKYGPMPAE